MQFSIVIPVYNEAGCLDESYAILSRVLGELAGDEIDEHSIMGMIAKSE